jgi:tellurite resistance protein TerC
MIWIWVAFTPFVLLMLALDLGGFHRKAHVVSVKEAIAWSEVWIALGLAFAVFAYFSCEGHWFCLGLVPDAVDGLRNSGSSVAASVLADRSQRSRLEY